MEGYTGDYCETSICFFSFLIWGFLFSETFAFIQISTSVRLGLVKIMERVLMELACTRAIAHLATPGTSARRVFVLFFKPLL